MRELFPVRSRRAGGATLAELQLGAFARRRCQKVSHECDTCFGVKCARA